MAERDKDIIAIGIDLGTTNSVVASHDGPQPRVLVNKDNKPQTRSVVGLKKKRGKAGSGKTEVLIGDIAVRNWQAAPKDTIVSIKRLMGRAVSDPQVQKARKSFQYEIVEPSDGTKDSVRVVMGGKEYSPVDISVMILSKLKEDAEFRLGKEVTHAVITVPAYFSEIQRKATRKAGLKAGMKIIMILDEPTAAAIAFGIDSEENADPKNLLVYDLGGGTFDISVLMWSGNAFAQLNLEGDMWLGGDNFDQVIIDYAVKYVRKEFGIEPTSNARFMAALTIAAQEAKETLSSSRSADLIVPSLLQSEEGDPIDVDIEITREEFERMVKPLVDKTVQLTKKALETAELTIDQIDHVLMAGNCTCIPMVQKAMEDMFGHEKVLRKVHPKQSVAMGAAITAIRHQGMKCPECGHFNDLKANQCIECGSSLEAEKEARKTQVEDIKIGGVAPVPYGTQSARDEFNVFINKNDPYETPVEMRKTLPFYTRIPNQRMIRIPVYGGNNLTKASLNEKQGEAFALLPPNLPKESEVHIKLWLDGDGIFELEAHLEDGTDLKPWKLEGEEDQKAAERLLKVEEDLKKIQTNASAEQLDKTVKLINEAFEQLQQGNFKKANEKAEEAEQATVLPSTITPDMETEAENLIDYVQFVLHEYSWALKPDDTYRLTNLVEETKKALEERDMATLEQKVAALDKATNKLPDIVRVLLGIKGAIAARIRPVDPEGAERMMEEVQEIENSFKSRDRSAPAKLTAMLAKFDKKMKEIEKLVPSKTKCEACGAELGHYQLKCPQCGARMDELDRKRRGSTGTHFGSSK